MPKMWMSPLCAAGVASLVLGSIGARTPAQPPPPTPPTRQELSAVVPTVAPTGSCDASSYVRLWPGDPVNDPTHPPTGQKEWHTDSSQQPYQPASYGSLFNLKQIGTGYGLPYSGFPNSPVHAYNAQEPTNEAIPDVPLGFSTQVCLLQPLMPGDFLPRSATLGGSSECLLPPGMADAGTGWQQMGRPTLEGAVDLITGLPMVQVTDLELPFDGATFRLKRTRSDNSPHARTASSDRYKWDPAGTDKWWDWAGQGWMIGENPLLLIDSKLPDAVGDNPPTCWLILDAHHSVPFQLIESTGRYEAPPRFRATLTPTNGRRHAIGGHYYWDPAPTEYKVSLYDGALTYTFVSIRDDVPPKGWYSDFLEQGTQNQWTHVDENARQLTYHDPPILPNAYPEGDERRGRADVYRPEINPGLGIPHYAICTDIADKSGHSVEIEYARSNRASLAPLINPNGSTDCIECQENSLAKGQIRSIKLKTTINGAQQTRWTLLYVTRHFAGVQIWSAFSDNGYADSSPFYLDRDQPPPFPWVRDVPPGSPDQPVDDPRYTLHGYSAVDRIYVYEGDLNLDSISSNSLTIPFNQTAGWDTNWDPITAWGLGSGFSNWKYQVHYEYNEYEEWPLDIYGQPQVPPYAWRWGYAPDRPASPPLLIMTSVVTRTAAGVPAGAQTTRTVFSYGSAASDSGGLLNPYDQLPWYPTSNYPNTTVIPWLNGVFKPDDVSRLVAAAVPLNGESGTATLRKLARHQYSDGTYFNDTDVDALLNYASLRLQRAQTDGQFSEMPHEGWQYGTATPFSPMREDFFSEPNHYIRGADQAFVRNDGQTTSVRDLTIQTDRGQANYRIHRFLVQPSESTLDPSELSIAEHMGTCSSPGHQPMASMFVNPYAWQGYTDTIWGVQEDLTHAPSNLTIPRFIAVIDEFNDRDSMVDSYHIYDQPGGTKQGQVSRRVVAINAWGLVLTDRKWEFTPAGVVRSGSGVGEEYIYDTVANVFPDLNFCDGTESDGCPDDRPSKALAHELLLTEHRSVGWSVADNQDPPVSSTQGLVRFFDYDVNRRTDLSFTDFPWPSRLHQVAEGVRRGTTGTKLYTTQTLYDNDNPANITASIRYCEPRTSSTIYSSPPAFGFGVAPDPGVSTTHFLIDRGGNSTDPMYSRPIASQAEIDPAIQQRPGGPWYYPATRSINDDQGNLIWQAKGLVLDPISPDAHSDPLCVLTLEFTVPGSYGPQATVTDAQPGSSPASSDPSQPNIQVPSLDGQYQTWGPLPANGQRLQYVTNYAYDDFGATDIWYPGGRRYARRWVIHQPHEDSSDDWIEEFEFNDLHADSGGLVTLMPGSRKEYDGSDRHAPPRLIEKGYYKRAVRSDLQFRGQTPTMDADTPSHPIDFPNDPTWQKIEAVRMARDANGRGVIATKLEHVRDINGEWVWLEVGSKQINDLGEVYREYEVGGNITRNTRNDLGQVLRTYVGTADLRWGPQGTLSGTDAHDMVLKERIEYGSGISDCWQPTTDWTYRSEPSWADAAYYEDPTSPDTDGYPKRIRHDWRMRAVRVDTFDRAAATGARLSTTLTFLNHADQPTMVVTFGPGAPDSFPGGVDPSTLLDAQPRPSAQRFFASDITPRPVSIIETFYGAGGSETERRTYDMQWAGSSDPNVSPPYLADRHFGGFGGAQVYSESPGKVVVSYVDGLGRVVSTCTVDPGAATPGQEYELARTDNVYDQNGNVIEVLHLERVKDAGNALIATGAPENRNAVSSRELRWYDFSNRLIATAGLGSGASTFISSGDPPARPSQPPAVFADDGSGTVIDTGLASTSLYSNAKIHIQAQDRKGIKTYDADLIATGSPHCRWRINQFLFDPNTRLVTEVENTFDPDLTKAKETDFGYTLGRLTSITGWRNSATPQTNHVVYGAEVLDQSFAVVSHTNALVGGMWQPLADSGKQDDGEQTYEIRLRYDFAGRVAERIDARGVAFRYSYDAAGRLASVQVGHYGPDGSFSGTYPDTMSGPWGDPVDRIGYVEYSYDSRQHLQLVTSRTKPGGTIITQNQFDFDIRGNLGEEYQSYGSTVSPISSAKILYLWDYLPTGDPGAVETGHNRLSSMTYPSQAGAVARVIGLGYGPSTVDDRLSRITALSTNIGTPTLAQFAYIGSDRRASLSMGGGRVVQDWRTTTQTGLAGLDPFGRPADMHVWSSSGDTLFRAQYSYDHTGDRISSQLTQASISGSPRDNIRSQVNSYDGLGRLVDCEIGQLAFNSGQTPFIDPGSRFRSDTWNLDLLGNWSGRPDLGIPGRVTTGDVNVAVTHGVNERNQIQSIAPGAGAFKSVTYDQAGNLIFDGVLFYQYDAWNRLLQINRASLADGTGSVISRIQVGGLVKHYAYDGLGRLVATQSPYPSPDSNSGLVRTERLYYDGVRRIQEVLTDPVASLAFAQDTGDPALLAIQNQCVDSDATPDPAAAPLAFETGQLQSVDAIPITPQPQLVREYVWGPGDGPAGIDELLVQYGPVSSFGGAPGGRIPYFVVQDAGGDVAALCDLGGSAGAARVVAQYTYDAYGEPLTVEHLFAHALLHCGHKGLFLDRLDVGVATGTGQENPRIWPYAQILCHNRNRAYLPALGRFAQADPNATALLLISSSALIQSAHTPDHFDFGARYTDSVSLYQYLGSSPFVGRDPYGTFDLVETGMSMGIAGFIGGMISGTMNVVLNQGTFWGGFWRGAAAGAAGGLAGACVSAYAASASGLFAALWARGAAIGAAQGATTAITNDLIDRKPWQELVADTLFATAVGAVVGGITGGIVDWARSGSINASAVRQAFSRLAGPNKCILGFLHPDGEVSFIECGPGCWGHDPAVDAGLVPRGSFGFSVLTNEQGAIARIIPTSELNSTIGNEAGQLPDEVYAAISSALRGR